MRREAIWIGQYPIYWYGIIMAASVLTAIIIANRESKRLGLPEDTIIDFALIGVPIATVFARLYYIVFEWSWSMFTENPWRVFAMWEGGIAMYGSLIGGALAAFIITKWRKVPFGGLVDAIAPGLVLAQAMGRWGNFTNQEAFGPQVTDSTWQFFPASVFIERTGQWHMATFFYESIWCLIVFLTLWFLVRKRTYARGQTFAFYMLLYAGGRAVIEGLRTDSLYLGSLRVSQFGSILIMVAVACFFFYRCYRMGVIRPKDWINLICVALSATLGILAHNAIVTEVAWMNWWGTFLCSFGLIVFAWAIWLIPDPVGGGGDGGDPDLRGMKKRARIDAVGSNMTDEGSADGREAAGLRD